VDVHHTSTSASLPLPVHTTDNTGAAMTVRTAELADADAVKRITENTWSDRSEDDYLGSVFPEWVAADDGKTAQTIIISVDSQSQLPSDNDSLNPDLDSNHSDDATKPVGVVQVCTLSETEAWVQGLRIAPEYRGRGLATILIETVCAVARAMHAAVLRGIVFSWNSASLGLLRQTGFDPGIEFRWIQPDPYNASIETVSTSNNNIPLSIQTGEDTSTEDVWSFWQKSQIRDALDGIIIDNAESWALSALRRHRIQHAATTGRLITVRSNSSTDAVRGFAIRNRTYEPMGEVSTPGVEYAIGAWEPGDEAAVQSLLTAVRRDATLFDSTIDHTRVLVPEDTRWLSDAAVTGVGMWSEPIFLMSRRLLGEVTG
jgi:Acetyltransferase (GNAT) family.